MNSTKNILIVGDGIAAWCLQFELLRQENVQITSISAPEHFPDCSTRSTSINCLRGTTKGVSPLGDLILSSFEEFENFYFKEKPSGIYQAIEYQLWNDHKKWERRYPEYLETKFETFLEKHVNNMSYYYPNEAYFIDPIKLRSWFQENSKNTIYKKELVKKITKDLNVITDVGEYQFDEIYFCTSYGSKNLLKGFCDKFDNYIDNCKPVAGTYLEIAISDTHLSFAKDFKIAIGKNHFIFRKHQGVIQIGSTSTNDCEIHLPNTKDINEIYDNVALHLNFELPAFGKFKQITGIRHKGHKRMPRWQEISPNLYSINGLYKNAFTFAFQAGRELANTSQNKL